MNENPWKIYRPREGESLTTCLMKEEKRRREAEKRWELLEAIFPYIAAVGIAISQAMGMALSENKNRDTDMVLKEMRWKAAAAQMKKTKIEEKKPFTHCEPRTKNFCRPGQTTVGGLEGNKCCE